MPDPGCPDQGQLHAQFMLRARADVGTISRLAGDLRPGMDRVADPSLARISMLLHRLAGTAGSFGFQGLGLGARRLDTLCRMLQQADDTAAPDRLQALLEGLREFPDELDVWPESRRPAPSLRDGEPSLPDVQPSLLHRDKGEPDPGADLQSPESPLVALLAQSSEFRTRLRRSLEGFGYRVAEFDHVAALELRAVEPGIAAIVAQLPAQALERSTLQRLRADDPDPPPLVLVGPLATFDGALSAVRGGADGYCTEPVDLPRLEARLHYLIEQRSRDGLRVLLVDDDRDLLAACRGILEEANMEVETVDDPIAALAALADFRPEVVVMDIRMPQCTGPELAQIIRLDDEWLQVPIVYMSTHSDGSDQMLATGKAGEGFLAKPIDARKLIATVTANGRHARQMVEMASRDTLTGLLKHSFIKEHLGAELERARRVQAPTCVVMIDIDHFKAVNDRHGHPAGDLVIRTLAALLRQRLRVADGIGRIGGEEFLAVLSDCGVVAAKRLMDDLRRHFADVEFPGQGMAFKVSFSAGLAESPTSTHDCAELLAAADKALYRAKNQGRNRVLVSRP